MTHKGMRLRLELSVQLFYVCNICKKELVKYAWMKQQPEFHVQLMILETDRNYVKIFRPLCPFSLA